MGTQRCRRELYCVGKNKKKLPLIHSHVPVSCHYPVIGVNLVPNVSLLPFPSLDLEFNSIKACDFRLLLSSFSCQFHYSVKHTFIVSYCKSEPVWRGYVFNTFSCGSCNEIEIIHWSLPLFTDDCQQEVSEIWLWSNRKQEALQSGIYQVISFNILMDNTGANWEKVTFSDNMDFIISTRRYTSLFTK